MERATQVTSRWLEWHGMDSGRWTLLASEMDSGDQGIHLGIHQTNFCYYVVIRRSGGGFHTGWTPKKSALTLAILRASPPSIPKGHEGTRTTTLGPYRLADRPGKSSRMSIRRITAPFQAPLPSMINS